MRKPIYHGIVNIDGGMTFDLESGNVIFVPNESVPDLVERYRKRGTGMQLSDGTFEFVPRKQNPKSGELIQKLPHGSLTKGRDGKIRLTLVLDPTKEEMLDIAIAIMNEGIEASKKIAMA